MGARRPAGRDEHTAPGLSVAFARYEADHLISRFDGRISTLLVHQSTVIFSCYHHPYPLTYTYYTCRPANLLMR
ncbi:unnamed protein product [Nippostrongylus brasiliensis]|uniref:Transposase n=1 Tax=Nippostrongylus brasiliensis TaxID=27835 RepID=A0A0N4Y3Q2_NIPBR|nr:unnamed protein product [Nippostrongylus brasiliensis]